MPSRLRTGCTVFPSGNCAGLKCSDSRIINNLGRVSASMRVLGSDILSSYRLWFTQTTRGEKMCLPEGTHVNEGHRPHVSLCSIGLYIMQKRGI